MTRWIVLTLALVVGVAAQDQTPPEAYDGQRNHAPPPEGFFCAPAVPGRVPPEHPCKCARMATRDPAGECAHDPDGKEHVMEDPQCTVFCHMDHCRCPIEACGS